MVRLGVDAWNLPGDRRGIGRYVRAILAQFCRAYADRVEPTLIVPEWPAWTAAAKYRRALDDHRLPVRSRRYVDRSNLDVLWFPFNGVSWEEFSVPAVATLHDATTFDLPGYDDAARLPFARAAQRCSMIITDSSFSAERLTQALSFPRERIEPIPLGVGPPHEVRRVEPEVESLRPFVLFVGEAEPRKGLPMLARAVTIARKRVANLRLVAVGRIPEGTDVPPSTDVLGHVDDATLAALYRSCAAFAYPSRYEGFGLPVLEAMSYGAPVVASSSTAIPEAGGDAALYVDPDDVDSWARTLLHVVTDRALANDLRARGERRAATMTWRTTAEATLAVLERVATRRVDDRFGRSSTLRRSS